MHGELALISVWVLHISIVKYPVRKQTPEWPILEAEQKHLFAWYLTTQFT